jgi:hypothetical protein
MSTLQKPKFKELPYSSFGGAPLLHALWNRFDLSLLLTQSGIFKKSGIATWKFAFIFVVGLMARCSSCLQMVKFYEKDALLRAMFGGKAVSQSAFSRFLVSPFHWRLFNLKRVAKFQEDAQTQLVDGDIIALDDTLIAHHHAWKIPFIYRLWDHCTETYIDAMNLVVLHAKKASGLQYPLFYSIWKQDNGKDPHLTRLDLALAMLTELRGQVAENLKLWVCFDAGYYGIDFYLAVEKLKFLWVTRAKINTPLFRKVKIRGKERFIPITPETLYKEAKPIFAFWRKKGNLCMAFKNIYIAIDEIHNGQGYLNKKVLKPINAVVSLYQKEDPKTGEMKQIIALFHSNQLDAKPEEIMGIYLQRWSIETFFWNAKQELGLNDCHSTDVNHIHAHLSLLFVAESLIRFAQWNYNEIEKTGLKEEVTHGKVVALLFHTRCEVHARSKDSIQVYFDTTSQRFANFFRKYWPNYLTMDWFDFQRNWEIYPQSG